MVVWTSDVRPRLRELHTWRESHGWRSRSHRMATCDGPGGGMLSADATPQVDSAFGPVVAALSGGDFDSDKHRRGSRSRNRPGFRSLSGHLHGIHARGGNAGDPRRQDRTGEEGNVLRPPEAGRRGRCDRAWLAVSQAIGPQALTSGPDVWRLESLPTAIVITYGPRCNGSGSDHYPMQR